MYRVINRETEEHLAVKAFNKDFLLRKSNGLTSLKNEIKLYLETDHNNIVQLYEIHETNGSVYLVMELCEGGPIIYRKN